MIDENMVYAVVWASDNKEKYGYKVFKDLLENWYKVIGINPQAKEILGETTFQTLSSFGKNIDVVIFVTPPIITEKVLEEVKLLNIKNVWFQPWSESNDAIHFCEKNKISYTANACIMIQRKI